MSDARSNKLTTAFELIEEERLSEARDILEPMLEADDADADTWWLYAHAVEDEDTARMALNNVHDLQPDYPGAETLKTQLQQKTGQKVDPASDFDDIDGMFGDFDNDEDSRASSAFGESKPKESQGFPRSLLLVIPVIALLLILAFVLLSGGDDDDNSSEPTNVAQSPTEATAEIVPTATLAVVPTVAEAGAAGGADLVSTFNAFALASNEPEFIESRELGQVFTIAVCKRETETSAETLDAVMEVLSEQVEIAEEAQAIGARLVDCQTDETLNIISVDTESAREFTSGTIDATAFQERWTVLDPSNS